jgi:hypothetical protein
MTGLLRINPLTNYWWGGYTIGLNNVPTSAYTMLNQTITVKITSYYNYQSYGENTITLNRTV